ncbi:MAG: signal transduction histidine kinase [Myxococcota bacterium]|jgi:signal transduction histidine kinase
MRVKRLYFRIYLTVLGMGLLTLLTVGVAFKLLSDGPTDVDARLRRVIEYVAADLPPEGPALAAALTDRGERLGVNLSLFSPQRVLLANRGPALGTPGPDSPSGGFRHGKNGMGVLVHLTDGRWLAAESDSPKHGERLRHFFSVLAMISLAIAVACYPIARRITRRLEALQVSVEGLGAGDLTARAEVQGSDEVAALATSFNSAAERIENLVTAQRRVLASASHELRSPLARIRMALALMQDEADPARRQGVARDAAGDIDELDALVGDVLLASKIEAGRAPAERSPVDLLGMIVEEAARVGAEANGAPTTISAHPAMLRRLVRNLLENAGRYGAPPIEISITSDSAGTQVVVEDNGEGIPLAERERIFEPFYRPDGHREGADGGVGLGLSLVSEIARAHGGTAHCEPREPKGTRFKIHLPQTPA